MIQRFFTAVSLHSPSVQKRKEVCLPEQPPKVDGFGGQTEKSPGKAKNIAFLSASEGSQHSELQQKIMISEILHCGLAALALRSETQKGLKRSKKPGDRSWKRV